VVFAEQFFMKRILVIDDQAEIRSMIAATLVVAGYAVRGATDGRDGILKVLIERPDLILCDIKMSGMDGYRTLEAIRKFPRTADIPFIIMTGSVVRSEFRRAMNWGADDYLSKPFTPDHLLAAVESRLARQSQSEREIRRRVVQPSQEASRPVVREPAAPLAQFA
jgi:CheY-like chemotaxis protein